MPRAARIRDLTGCRRRTALRRSSANCRYMMLSHGEIGTRHQLHVAWLKSITAASINEAVLHQLLILKVLLITNVILPPNINIDAILDFIVHLTSVGHATYGVLVSTWLRLDHLLYDITPLEASYSSQFTPYQNVRLDDWDDLYCKKYTSFLGNTLRDIYRLFGLANIADNDGFIHIPTGHTNDHGVACRYRIHAEELFLFFMTRMKKGWSINDLVDQIFGGYYNRWSYGWPWMLRYLDDRYRNILGHQGLLRFVHLFPQFFDAIENHVKKPKWHRDAEGNVWWSPGLENLPYWIFGFIDCSIYGTNVPYSGPDGDIIGAGRKRWYDVMQRAIYTGFTHGHGMKVETVRLPNGISTVFGPVSDRRVDISYTGRSVQDMSGLNEFLRCIQLGRYPRKYAALGDGIYGVEMECIRSYFKAHFTRAQVTPYMRVCDAEMKACRQSIEWGYGKTSNVFAICKNEDNFKLGKQNPVSCSIFHAIFFFYYLSNI